MDLEILLLQHVFKQFMLGIFDRNDQIFYLFQLTHFILEVLLDLPSNPSQPFRLYFRFCLSCRLLIHFQLYRVLNNTGQSGHIILDVGHLRLFVFSPALHQPLSDVFLFLDLI